LRRLILLGAIAALGTLVAQQAEYQGPTILSRGLGTALQSGGSLLRLRPYLSLTGVYDGGLTPVAVDASGRIPQEDLYGGDIQFGVYGYRGWRRSLLGIDYRGGVRHYTRKTYYDGSDHNLTLGFNHQPTRRLAFTFREAAGTTSRNHGIYSGYAYFDPAFADVPANDLFNGRVYYASTLGDLTYLKSQRLSFNIGGSGVVVRRRSKALVGVTGATARADVQYKLGRAAAIGADYDFTHYEFTNAFGASDIHTVSLDLSFRLGRWWDLGLRGGGARVETLGLQRVAVDPIVAAIIGRATGIEAVYRLHYIPSGQVKLSRAFRRSTLSFDYSTGVSAGNGIYMTSRGQSASFGYSHTAFRRWNFGLTGGYSSLSGLAQEIAKYQSYNAGGGFSCQVNTWMHIVGRYDARRYDAGQAIVRRVTHSASLGIAFSPGDLPLSLW
jgi:hypothetical protein